MEIIQYLACAGFLLLFLSSWIEQISKPWVRRDTWPKYTDLESFISKDFFKKVLYKFLYSFFLFIAFLYADFSILWLILFIISVIFILFNLLVYPGLSVAINKNIVNEESKIEIRQYTKKEIVLLKTGNSVFVFFTSTLWIYSWRHLFT